MHRTFVSILVFFALHIIHIHAQVQSIAPTRYWIQFTNKGHTPYSLSNPGAYLSTYSLNRKKTHSISVDSLDLPVDPAYIDSIKATGAQLLNISKWFNAITVKLQDSTEMAKIKALPFVNSTQAVGAVAKHKVESIQGAATLTPYDTTYFGASYHQLDMLHDNDLQAMGYTGRGVRIAILDAGFTSVDQWYVYDSLIQQQRVIDHWDFVRHRGDSAYYFSSHGAMVLSTIAANAPGAMMGAAPGVSVALYHTEDVNSENEIEEDNWCSAAERADSLGVDIISSSLGYNIFDSSCLCGNLTYNELNGRTAHISTAAVTAARKGILVCSSAGNEGDNMWYHITAPADADSILTVGAVGANDSIAIFSSRGPTADGRIKPELVAEGLHTTVFDPDAGIIVTNSGTSFSNPLIAGAAAVLWQTCPTASNMQVRHALIESANRYLNPNNNYGYGIPNLHKADSLLCRAVYYQNLTHIQVVEPVVSPNPTNGMADVLLINSADSMVTTFIDVYNLLGQKVAQYTYTLTPGINTLAINQHYLWPSGMYLIRIKWNNTVYTRKLMVTNNSTR